jgi:hypothetical protein
MSQIGFIGSRGDVVHGRDDDESRRKIPFRITCLMATCLNLITLLIYGITWAKLAQGWWNEYEPNMWVGSARASWRRISLTISNSLAWASPRWITALIPLMVEWIASFVILIVFDQLIRIVTAEGLIPYSQYNTNDGLRTTWGMLFHQGETILERTVENPHFVRVNSRASRRAKRRNEEQVDTTPAWVVEAYRVVCALWGEKTLSREAFKHRLGRGGSRLYYKYVKGTRNERAWFQQWGVIEQADNRGAWRWCKSLPEVLAVDPQLQQYAQQHSPTPPTLVSG